MSLNRIVFLGNNEIGKTKAIECLCNSTLLRNTQFQYGLINFGENYQLQLVDLSDHKLVGKISARSEESNLGFVLLVDTQKPRFMEHLVTIIEYGKPYIVECGLAIGLLNERSNPLLLETINKRVRDLGIKAPVFEVEPNSREDMATLIKALLISLDCQLSAIH